MNSLLGLQELVPTIMASSECNQIQTPINTLSAQDSSSKEECWSAKENFHTLYLSNVPENATIKNIHGAVRSKIGKFVSIECAFLSEKIGTCRLVLRDADAKEKLLDGPISIFGVDALATEHPPHVDIPLNYFPVYVRGLSSKMRVKKFLGLVKKALGIPFVAMNKVEIDGRGRSKITFQSKELQNLFLERHVIEGLQHIEVSLVPFDKPASCVSRLSEQNDYVDQNKYKQQNIEYQGDQSDSASHDTGTEPLHVLRIPPIFTTGGALPTPGMYINEANEAIYLKPDMSHFLPFGQVCQGVMWLPIVLPNGKVKNLSFHIMPKKCPAGQKKSGTMVMPMMMNNGQVTDIPFYVLPIFPPESESGGSHHQIGISSPTEYAPVGISPPAEYASLLRQMPPSAIDGAPTSLSNISSPSAGLRSYPQFYIQQPQQAFAFKNTTSGIDTYYNHHG